MKSFLNRIRWNDFAGLYVTLLLLLTLEILDVTISYISSSFIPTWQEANILAGYPDTHKFWLGPSIAIKLTYYNLCLPILAVTYFILRAYLNARWAAFCITLYLLYIASVVAGAVAGNTMFLVFYTGWLKAWFLQHAYLIG
jgi:hypothetical protein